MEGLLGFFFKIMDGFRQFNEVYEPLRKLPSGIAGKRIALRITGGLGDTLISVGACAKTLQYESPRVIDAYVKENHIEIVKLLEGVNYVGESKELNDPTKASMYDVVLSFRGVLAGARVIKDGEYYSLVEEFVGRGILTGEFSFRHNPQGKNCVAIHPGASNPNRRWDDSRWEALGDLLLSNGYSLAWLGTKDEFGFDSDRSINISAFDETIVTQSKMLASCDYFIGNDSGFAHIAGMLGVPGLVFFSATHPDNVIARYPNLVGIHNFETLGVTPTRSLRADDEQSRKAMDSITLEQVSSEFSKLSGSQIAQCTHVHSKVFMRPRIALVNAPGEIASYLESYFDVLKCKNIPETYEGITGGVFFQDDECWVFSRNRKVRAKFDHPENLRKAIRDLILGDFHG